MSFGSLTLSVAPQPLVQGGAEQGYAFREGALALLRGGGPDELICPMHLPNIRRPKERREFRRSVADGNSLATVPLRRVGLLAVDAQRPPRIV